MSDADLDALLSRRAWVTVTNPVHGSSWSGQLIAMHSDPGVIIEQADGVRMCLPQSFTIAECEVQERTGSAADLHASGELRELIARKDAELESLRATIADYENRITWNTSCGACARLLDSCRSADERAEKAEALMAERDAEIAGLRDPRNDGAALIAAERRRQIAEEGYTAGHDAGHEDRALTRAAIWYAADTIGLDPGCWPPQWRCKRSTIRRQLVKAGALIAAEIDRMAAPEAKP